MHPDYRDQVDQRIQMVNLKKKPVSLRDETYIRMDGTPVEVEVSAVPVVYEGKDGAVVFMRDVTERKRAEHALQRSETQYRTLFGQMLEGFAYCRMVYDAGGRPVDWIYLDTNPAFGRLTGLHDINGKRATDAIPGIREMHPELFETYARVARTGEPETIEIHFEPLDIWLNLSLFSPEKDHFVAVFENISERKKTEEALKSSGKLYRLLADNAGDVIWVVDIPTRRFTYVSPSVERLWGYPPDEFLMLRFETVITPESYRTIADNFTERLAAYHSGDDSVRVQVIQADHLHKDGSIIPTEAVTTILSGPDRLVTRILGVSRDLRERMRYEDALIDSEKRLRRAELLGKLGHWEVYIDTGMVVGSEGAREIYGLRQPEITFEDIKVVPLPEYRSLLDQAFTDLVNGARPYDLQFKIRNSEDGSVRTIHSVAEYDPARRVVFGTIHDISAEDDKKICLPGKEQVFRDLVENLNDVVFCVDLDGVITYVSPAGERQFGYPPSDLLHTHFMDLVCKDDRPELGRRWQELGNGIITPLEWRIIRKDGSMSWVRTSTRPMIENDRVVGYEGIICDVSARKRSDDAMRESENRYRVLAESTPDAIFTLSREGVVTYVNESGGRMLGRSPARLEGKNIADIFPPGVSALQIEHVRNLFDSGLPYRDTTESPGPNGPHSFDTLLIPLKAPDGTVTSVLGISRDIPDLRRKKRP